jgi:predicted permease
MFQAIGQAVACVLGLSLIGLVGYVLEKRRWFSPETKTALARIVSLVCLPPYLFTNVVRTFGRDEFSNMIRGVLIPVISIGLTYGLSVAVVRLARVRQNRRGLIATSIASSNTIFIGLPVNTTIFGDTALPYVLIYFLANSAFLWTIGNYSISLDGGKKTERVWSQATLKRLISPPLVGFSLGLLVTALGLAPPQFLMAALGSIGGMTTPLALIFTGLALAGVRPKTRKPDKDALLLLCGRFVAAPFMLIILLLLFPVTPLMAKVFVIQSSLPMATNIAILAGFHNSDANFASLATAISTLMSLLTIPFYTALTSSLFQ